MCHIVHWECTLGNVTAFIDRIFHEVTLRRDVVIVNTSVMKNS